VSLKAYLEAGKIVACHGVKGEVRVQPWCDSPEFLCGFKTLYYGGGDVAVTVESARKHKNIVIMKFKDADTVEQAERFRGEILYIDRKDAPLPDGNYFVQDIIGLTVTDTDGGNEIGELFDVSFTGANDVYHIKTKENKTLLIPAIPSVVKGVDLDAKTMMVRLLDGLE
jgi:16S rRNA processing protein RimM